MVLIEPRMRDTQMTPHEIRTEIARLEMSRRVWPGLDADEEDYVQAMLTDLRSDLAVAEDAEAELTMVEAA